MAEANVGDVMVRLKMYMESDALDFQKTGRAVLVVEDGVAELPLPQGKPGRNGDPGPAGSSLRPDLVLDEESDSAALEVLRRYSANWRATGADRRQFFAINKPTKSGFFYNQAGWTIMRDIFGANSEIAAGEFTFPTLFRNVAREPVTPIDGVVVYAQEGVLKVKKADGTVKTIA